nr:hypothetical protein TetV2_00461 [Oceanusvirus sp.]
MRASALHLEGGGAESGTQTETDDPAPAPSPPSEKPKATGLIDIAGTDYSEDYIENVQGFVSYVIKSALEKLKRRISEIERTAITDATVFHEMNKNRLEARRKLAEIDKKIVEAQKNINKWTAQVNESKVKVRKEEEARKKNQQQRGYRFGGDNPKSVAEATGKIAEAKAELENYRDQKKKLEKQADTKYPPPVAEVYVNALQRFEQAAREFLEEVRDRSNEVMRRRADGPMIKLDPEVYTQIEDKVKETFQMVHDQLVTMLSKEGKMTFLQKVVDLDLQQIGMYYGETDKFEIESRKTILMGITEDISYQVESLLRSIEQIGETITTRLSKRVDVLSSVAKYDLAALYVLKLCRVGLAYAASFVSARIFENIYVDRLKEDNEGAPDLKWMVVTHLALAAVFDGCLVAMTYFVSSVMPMSLDMNLVKDFMVDTVAGITMTLVSAFPISDIIQDRRYFEYAETAPRALRLMKNILWSLSSLHATIPYFYLTGPFYLQHKAAATKTT